MRGEKIVQEALDRVAATRTTIMIAHRLSTIRKADRIIVLQNGTKKEQGNHEELMAIEDGLYFNLVNAQKINSESSDTEDEKVEDILKEENPMEETSTVKSDNEESQKSKKERTDYLVLPRIVGEQSSLWYLWIPLMIAAMGAGGMLFKSLRSIMIVSNKPIFFLGMNSLLCSSELVFCSTYSSFPVHRQQIDILSRFLVVDVLHSRLGSWSLLRCPRIYGDFYICCTSIPTFHYPDSKCRV